MSALLSLPIEGDWPNLGIDATCSKARQAGEQAMPTMAPQSIVS